MYLESRHLAANNINQQLAAVRRLSQNMTVYHLNQIRFRLRENIPMTNLEVSPSSIQSCDSQEQFSCF